MYSDKILAVVREYSCNAVDANKQAGYEDKPIEIRLPSRLLPEFSVRDYGQGLTFDEIENIYTKYGESTKRHSNEYIGMLGIGCKSAFAYSDNFIVKSYLDGKLYCYEALIDPSKVGKITLLGVSETEEPNGVEVTVPVKKDDENIFHEKAKTFFNHFKIKPIIKGYKNFFEEETKPLLEGEDWEWIEAERGHYHSYGGGTLAIMGNVAYEIKKDSLKNLPDGFDNLLCQNLRMYFDIGDLNIAASREQLEYTDRTIKRIISKVAKVKKEIKEAVEEKFKSEDSVWGAMVIYNELFDFSSGYYSISRIIDKVNWKGNLIDDGKISVNDYGENSKFEGVEISRYEKSNRASKYRKVLKHYITPKSETVLYKNDLKGNRGLYQRVNVLIDEGKDVYIAKFLSDKVEKDFYEESKISSEMVKEISEVKIPEKSKAAYNRTYQGYNPKNNVKILLIDVDAVGKDTEFWNPITKNTKKDTGYYVEINRYKPIGFSETKVNEYPRRYHSNQDSKMDTRDFIHSYGRLAEIIKSLPDINNIYGVKTSTVPKLGKGWVNIMDFIKSEVKTYLEESDLKNRTIDELNRDSVANHFDWISTDGDSYMAFTEGLGRGHKFVEFVKRFLSVKRNEKLKLEYENIRMSFGVFGEFMERVNDDKESCKHYKTAEKFVKEYPMLDFVRRIRHDYNYKGPNLDDIKNIAKYIGLADADKSVS
jgi:hypothetical protein